MNTKQYDISSIVATITSGISSESEYSGVLHDLTAISQRLSKKEYKKGFISTNIYSAEQRTKHAFAELLLLSDIAESWRTVFESIDIYQYDSVIDLAPGYTPKIELALTKVGYTKSVVILDTNTTATSQLMRVLSLFNPTYTLQAFSSNILTNHSHTSSCVVGNHIIDDLIISYISKRLSISSETYYTDEKTAQLFWNRLTQHPLVFGDIASAIAEGLAHHVRPHGLLILTKYKSYMERLLDLSDMAKIVSIIFRQVISILKSQYSFREENIHPEHFPKKSYITLPKFTILRKS